MKLSGRAAVPSKINASLDALVKKHLPADYSAGCRFIPVAGLSSESWRIDSPQRRSLARLGSRDKRLLGIDRQREQRLLRHLSAAALAPSVRLWAKPWLLLDWVEGETQSPALFFSQPTQQQLATMLATLHGVQPIGNALDIKRRLQAYWQAVDVRRLTPAWLRWHQRLIKRPLPQTLKLAIAHMDIHPDNWVTSPRGERLIDWEYAAATDIALEFAALFRGNAYAPRQQRQLLQYYALCGGYRDIPRLEQQIRRWQPWLDYLMLLWFEVRWQQTGELRYVQWAQPLREQLFGEIARR
ncbi:phosphotransferase [Rouxiella aceris]|uniref:phosphotransferase n=1 Tax=Rouxiella aceris TaxID=2703884 RepID=UPI002E2E7F66|nr:phosphotransferase [Rouxiella aceris]